MKPIKFKGYLTRNDSIGIDSVTYFHFAMPKLRFDKNVGSVSWESKGIKNIVTPAIQYLERGECISVEVIIKERK